MATFSFQVDRVFQVLAPLTLHPDVGLMSEPFKLEAGARVVYRGVVELGGSQRHVFDVVSAAGASERQKGYSRDRAQLERGLAEDYDALIKV